MATTVQLIIPAAAALLGSVITGGIGLIISRRQEKVAKQRELLAIRRTIYADTWRRLNQMRQVRLDAQNLVAQHAQARSEANEFIEGLLSMPWWRRRRLDVQLYADELAARGERVAADARKQSETAADLAESTFSTTFAELQFFASDRVRAAIGGVLAAMEDEDPVFRSAMDVFTSAIRRDLNG